MTFKVKDHFYNKAKKENYLARSVYKLEEIDAKYKLFKKGKNHNILDLGYYPGSWTQYALQKCGHKGMVVGVDIKELNNQLDALPNLTLFQKDIYDISKPSDVGQSDPFDLLLSDMAPNTTGVAMVDQAKSLNLVEYVFSLSQGFLKKDGHLVVKVFDSQDAQNFLKTQKKHFQEFYFLKPKSTRKVSREFFAIGKYFKG